MIGPNILPTQKEVDLQLPKMNITEKRMLELTGQIDIVNETFYEKDPNASDFVSPRRPRPPIEVAPIPQPTGNQFLIPGPVKKWIDSLSKAEVNQLSKYLTSMVIQPLPNKNSF